MKNSVKISNDNKKTKKVNKKKPQKVTILGEEFDVKLTTDISITYSGITELPENLVKLINLKYLDLSGNRLTSLPESIGNLTKLTSLNLTNNKLTSLPENIGKLKNLRVSFNK